MQCSTVAKEAVAVYIDGDAKSGVSRHLVGSGGRVLSKVLTRHQADEARFSCLI